MFYFLALLFSQISFYLGRLKSALRFCGQRVPGGFFAAVSRRHCAVFLDFRGSVGRRLAVFISLSLSLSLSFVFLLFVVGFLGSSGAAALFLMPRPVLG